MIPESNSGQTLERTIRPIGVAALHGMAVWEEKLIAVDSLNGYLLEIDPYTDNTTVLNPQRDADLTGVTGLAIADNTLWLTKQNTVYFTTLGDDSFNLQPFVRLAYDAEAIAVLDSTVYVTSQRTGYLLIFSRATGKEVARFPLPGVGVENITIRGEELWLSDTVEQTIYCLDRATGEIKLSILTPFESPTGLTFFPDPLTGKSLLYVAYAFRQPYLRDNPNADPNYELQYRDRTFIHPLAFHYDPERRMVLSNGYLVEMSYVEELAPLEDVELKEVEWRIALPAQTDRQKIRQVSSIGIPFTEEVQNGQRVAVFKFPHLKAGERHIFGWKALMEVWSIKYQLKPRDLEKLPSLSAEYQARYLIDDDDLSMGTEIIQRAAREAIGRETNLLRKMYKIRNYVYDKLSYGIKPHIDSPDVVLARGIGSCGEYLGVLLALARLNGIACRTVGRYKCPAQPDLVNVPLEPDFNHVWMEFYVPGFGWLPMESNPDDVIDGGPYPSRFFMGLAWYHAEIGKGITFETLTSEGLPVAKDKVSIGELAINHVRFTIIQELQPTELD